MDDPWTRRLRLETRDGRISEAAKVGRGGADSELLAAPGVFPREAVSAGGVIRYLRTTG